VQANLADPHDTQTCRKAEWIGSRVGQRRGFDRVSRWRADYGVDVSAGGPKLPSPAAARETFKTAP